MLNDVKDIKSVIQFLIYVMPGFLALRTYRAARPVRQPSDFVQVAWSLMLGVVISSVVHVVDGRCFHGGLRSASSDFPSIKLLFALGAGGLITGWSLILIHEG